MFARLNACLALLVVVAVLAAPAMPAETEEVTITGQVLGPDEEMLEEAFRYAFDRLKPSDAVVVGVYQKLGNHVAQNAALVRRILAGAAQL